MAQNFLHDLISSPSYGVLVSAVFASSPVYFIFFWLPSLVRAKIPSNAWVFRAGIRPLPLSQAQYEHPPPPQCQKCSQSWTQFTLGGSLLPFRKAWLLTCHYYAMSLNTAPSTLPFHQSGIVGVTLCTRLQNHGSSTSTRRCTPSCCFTGLRTSLVTFLRPQGAMATLKSAVEYIVGRDSLV